MAWAASRAGWPANSSGSMTFSSAVRFGSSWNDWNTKPTWLARSRARPSSSRANRSWPASLTLPALGTSSPASSPSKVDLPEPELPVMATALPASTVKSIPSRIDSVPPASATRLPSPFTSIELLLSMRLFFRLLYTSVLTAAAIAPGHAQTAPSAQGSAPRAVLVLGDSLSAEYGIKRGTGWVPLLSERISQQYPKYKVVNASISGDTTSGGVARLPALLRQHAPAVVVLELGSNDALRGLSLTMTEQNLRNMAQAARQADADVVIVGMQIPPNYGRDYTQRFAQLFPTVAKDEKARLVPFLMEGIATNRAMFQADGIHPNEDAQPQLLDNVWPALRPLLN